jgi:hypothetical protein
MADFYLPRHDQQALLDLLKQVPALAEDLTVAIARQDRTTALGPKTSRGDDVQPLPFNEHASDAAGYLYFTLANWTGAICTARTIDYDDANNVISVARWLRIHIIDIALTPTTLEPHPDIEGSRGILADVRHAIRNGNRACGGASDKAVRAPEATAIAVADARQSILNARGIERAAKHLCWNGLGEYRTLTEQRVYRLARAGVIHPDRMITLDGQECALYVLGDVLDAHVAYPSRSRKAVPA